jgi:hypothetical protein
MMLAIKNSIFMNVTPYGSCGKLLARATRRHIPDNGILLAVLTVILPEDPV